MQRAAVAAAVRRDASAIARGRAKEVSFGVEKHQTNFGC